MGIATSLLLLPILQDPQPVDAPKFVWPPVLEAPQSYIVRLHKERRLSTELAAAERKARAALSLPAPPRGRQSIGLEIDVELRPAADAVLAAYAVRVPKAPELRLKLLAEAPAEAVALLDNSAVPAVWGHADGNATEVLAVPRAAVERRFEQRFKRDGRGGVEAASFAAHFGDHLLPVLWDQPLPCWIGHMATVLELGGAAAFDGKTLIRDGSGSFPLGHRETRVDFAFTAVSGDAFSIRYRMKVRQVVSHTRDLKGNLAQPFTWVFEIDGEADYSAAEQSFARIREKVSAWPEEPTAEHAARLRDEAFTGTIEVERVVAKDKPKPRGR